VNEWKRLKIFCGVGLLVAVRQHLRLVFDTAALRESASGAGYL